MPVERFTRVPLHAAAVTNRIIRLIDFSPLSLYVYIMLS